MSDYNNHNGEGDDCADQNPSQEQETPSSAIAPQTSRTTLRLVGCDAENEGAVSDKTPTDIQAIDDANRPSNESLTTRDDSSNAPVLPSSSNIDDESEYNVRTLAHELSNLIDGSMRYANLAARHIDHLSPEHSNAAKAHDDLEAANRGMQQIIELLDRWMRPASPDIVEQYWQDGTAEDALNRACQVLQPYADEMGTTLMVTICEKVSHFNAGPVGPLFINAIKNAIEAANAGGRVDVSLSYDARDLIFEVRNDGTPLPAEFPRDERGVIQYGFSTKPNGHGLGLRISSQLVESLGGKLWLVDEPESGTLLVARWHPPTSPTNPNTPFPPRLTH